MRIMKSFGVALLALCAVFGLYTGYGTAKGWYEDYQQQRAQTHAMWTFLAEPVGTRTVEGKQEPLNRADALAFIVQQAVEQAKVHAPVGK